MAASLMQVDEAPLPVRLVSFTVQKSEGNAQLQWKTTSEVNASHFEIERSVDGKKYNAIGNVQADGKQDSERSYSFTDTGFSSLAVIAYYRLRSVDKDGSFTFSRVERLQPDKDHVSQYVYPNPARTGASVTINAGSYARNLQVLDLQGRKINVRVMQRNSIGFVLDQIPQGVYLIRFDTGSGHETRKLVVD